MAPHALIAIAGGLLSAFFTLAFAGGSALGVLFAYVAPLPLFLVALGLGLRSVLIASGIGVIAIAFFGGLLSSSMYCLLYVLPAYIICKATKETNNDISSSTSDENNQRVGQILVALSMSSAIVFVIAVIVADTTGFTKVTLNELINETITKSLPTLQDIHRNNLINIVFKIITSPFFPGVCSSSWIILVIINAVIAQGLLVQLNKNIQPSPSYKNFSLPSWWSWPLVLAASLSLFGMFLQYNSIEFLGRNLTMMLAIPYFFLGLAVVHRLASQTRFKWLYLSLMYFTLLASGNPEKPHWAAILITGIGVFEHWFDIKNIAKLIRKITNADK